jgi:amino-acid N-acetyltransferase
MFRKANEKDIDAVFGLIDPYAQQILMLPRSRSDIRENINEFYVFEEAGEVVGTAALKFGWDLLAEIRSLAVRSDKYRNQIGLQLVTGCIEEAKTSQMEKIFVLTYVRPFFEKLGFQTINKSALPLKVWEDCMGCTHRHACDEIALIRELKSVELAPLVSTGTPGHSEKPIEY